MKNLLVSFLVLIATNSGFSQNSKPTFQIIVDSQNHTDYSEIMVNKTISLFKNRGFNVNNDATKTDLQSKAEYNISISIQNKEDSTIFKIEIIESSWGTTITSAITSVENEKININTISLDLCDEIFASLMRYFETMFNNGQIIKLTIKSNMDLEKEISTNTGNKQLFNLINELIDSNSINKPLLMQRSDFELIYKIKIPIVDDKGKSITVLTFGNKIKTQLKSVANLRSELTTVSLFEAKLDL
jgi:hypothetical protein